jgi:4-azaleucine resistance transporter AzlC
MSPPAAVRPSGASAAFLLGVRALAPLLVGVAPFGLIYGVVALKSGLSPAAAMAMSSVLFAGSSQFLLAQLVGLGAPAPVMIGAVFLINLRHALYSATLLPYARTWPLRQRLPLAFWLTDETFAVVEYRLRTHGAAGGAAYQFGSSLAMYGNWAAWTGIGVLLGQSIPGLADWGLDFAMLATFAAIVAPQLVKRPALLAAVSASAVALLCRGWPYKLDLMLAALVGVVVGVAAEGRQRSTVTEGDAQ